MPSRANPGGALRVTITGADKASEAFKAARREMRREMRQIVVATGERIILPAIRPDVPTPVRRALTIRATGSRGYVTVKGSRKLDRILGVWNFGGTVRAAIRPRDAKALTIGGGGIIRAAVNTPRVHKGTHKIERNIERKREPYVTELMRRLMQSFDGFEHTP